MDNEIFDIIDARYNHEVYQYTFMIISHSFLLRMRNVSGKRCTKSPNHNLCSTTFIFRKILQFMR